MPRESEIIAVKDPVCGSDVDAAEAAGRLEYEEYQGWAYFFCSAKCHALFQASPDRYAERRRMFVARGPVEDREEERP